MDEEFNVTGERTCYNSNMFITSENILNAANQQGSPKSSFVTGFNDPSETTRRAPTIEDCKAYLLGASHDGTFSSMHNTFRFSQKSELWLMVLRFLLKIIGCKSWIYKEGKSRGMYILETTAEFLRKRDDYDFFHHFTKAAYIRGYFDAEGGVPHQLKDRFYIQLCQKNYSEMKILKEMIEFLGVRCGEIHNPSKRVDPDYWRFYILSCSRFDFMERIGSWHPVKRQIFYERMKI